MITNEISQACVPCDTAQEPLKQTHARINYKKIPFCQLLEATPAEATNKPIYLLFVSWRTRTLRYLFVEVASRRELNITNAWRSCRFAVKNAVGGRPHWRRCFEFLGSEEARDCLWRAFISLTFNWKRFYAAGKIRWHKYENRPENAAQAKHPRRHNPQTPLHHCSKHKKKRIKRATKYFAAEIKRERI